MKVCANHSRDGGFVVVVVLCVIILLSVVLCAFYQTSRAALAAAERFRTREQARHCASAGLHVAIAAVQSGQAVAPNGSSATTDPDRHSFPVGPGRCTVSVVAENGKLDVNHLVDSRGRPDRIRVEQMLRLIDVLNRRQTGKMRIGYGIVPAIIDWIDRDEDVTYLPFVRRDNIGAESKYYSRSKTPYRCKNAPIATIEELLAVRGVTEEVLAILSDCITAGGDGKINLNASPQPVLEALSTDIDRATAERIVRQRSTQPFESIVELNGIEGLSSGAYQALSQAVTTGSSGGFYRVVSHGSVGEYGCGVMALLKQNPATKSVDIVLCKEFGPEPGPSPQSF